MTQKNYNLFPCTTLDAPGWSGWEAIVTEIAGRVPSAGSGERFIIAIECFPGVDEEELHSALLQVSPPIRILRTRDVFLSAEDWNQKAAPYLGGDDPLFGFLSPLGIDDLCCPERLNGLRSRLEAAGGPVILLGSGACHVAAAELCVYADVDRGVLHHRMRTPDFSNLGIDNRRSYSGDLYKRAFFLDWRIGDRIREATIAHWDLFIDTSRPREPSMTTGDAIRAGLAQLARQPFRLVPFFDPGPWGGRWMREKFGLDPEPPNFAWCFDGVPDHLSLGFECDGVRLRIQAPSLLMRHGKEVLGPDVLERFHGVFPIRFDLLDTIDGGNLSLQVHPLEEYLREHCGETFTQDESYYMLDAQPGAEVYLGFRPGIDQSAFEADLRSAADGGPSFPADRYAATWPARKHDHFLIPAGTIHCSGKGCMVLEISATPYIYTFKLWDWDRLGLDGRPRPVNIDRGMANLCFERDADWAKRELINRIEPSARGGEWREERTGLHPLEPIESRRTWFTGPAPHDTQGTVNVLNLVEGRAAVVESPDRAFDPFEVHYAETFIIPAAVGRYTIRPAGSSPATEHATMKASIRPLDPTT